MRLLWPFSENRRLEKHLFAFSMMNHLIQNPIKRQSGRQALFDNNARPLLFALIGICFKTVSVLGFSTFTQKILDTVSGTETHTISDLVLYALSCVVCLLIAAVLEYRCWTQFRSNALLQYRAHIYDRVLKKNIAAFQSESGADYLSAISNDLSQIKDGYIESLPYIAELVLNFVGTMILMLYYDPKLAAIAVGISVFPIIASLTRMQEVSACEENLSAANSLFLRAFSEVLQGFRIIKSTKSETQISGKLLAENRNASHAFCRREHTEIAVAYTASLTGHVAQIIFFIVSMLLARSDGRISAGVIVAFVQLMRNIIQMAITMPELLARVKAAKSLMRKHDTLLENSQPVGRDIAVFCKQSITLDHVTAGYNVTDATLKNITYEFQAHGCYAIIGESGSGKTTLLNLLTGFHRQYTGDIRYDNTSIKDVSNDNLCQLISVIHQDVFIFDATIAENLSMFRPCSEAALWDAACKAGLSSLIEQKGLDYRCGENGNLLSGGEKQRIGIARSILQGTDVLLFDEVTSALDAKTGHQVMDTIQKMSGKTRIVITHDIYPDLMDHCVAILVLKDGQLAEAGTFRELIAKQGTCYNLVNKLTL